MADKIKKSKKAEKGRGKGVAFAKWAKIDRAQRNMLMAVCGASVILGVTVVGIIYSVRVISFNASLMSEKDGIIKDYKSVQGSLDKISSKVNELRDDERLEVVARTRSADCLNISTKSLEELNINDLELAKICTSLRIIPDALPTKLNEEATMASFNQLVLWADPAIVIQGISKADVGIPSDTSSDSSSSSSSASDGSSEGGVTGGNLNAIGLSVTIEGETNNVQHILDTIERSVRNYDISSANVSFVSIGTDENGNSTGSGLQLGAIYRAYYSEPTDLSLSSKKICADKNSEKCTGRKKK